MAYIMWRKEIVVNIHYKAVLSRSVDSQEGTVDLKYSSVKFSRSLKISSLSNQSYQAKP